MRTSDVIALRLAIFLSLFSAQSLGRANELNFVKPAKRLVGHASHVTVMAFSPDGKTLASAGENGELFLWDVATLKGRKIDASKVAIYGLAFLSNQRLAFAGKGDQIVILHVATAKIVHQLAHQQGTVAVLAIDPSKKVLASGGYNGEIALWHTENWKKLISLRGHPMRVTDLAFAPNGKSLASGGITETEFTRTTADHVRVWDIDKGRLIHKLAGYGNRVCFTSDGKYVVAAALRLWSNPKAPKNFVTRMKDGTEHVIDGGQYTTFWKCETGEKVAQVEGIGLGVTRLSGGKYFLAEIGMPQHWDGWLYDAARNAKDWGKTVFWNVNCENEKFTVIQRDGFDGFCVQSPVEPQFASLAPDGWRQNAIQIVDYILPK